MKEYVLNPSESGMMNDIPMISDSSAVYLAASSRGSDIDFIRLLDKFIGLSDAILAKWLNITSRTLRNYRKDHKLVLKEATREHVLLLLALYRHGKEVFGSTKDFELWLSKENPLLGNRLPGDLLETVSGIQFINDRLTAIEYGENV